MPEKAKKTKKKEISIFKSKKYLLKRGKDFDDYLNQVKIASSEEKKIKEVVLTGIIKDEVLGLFPVGKAIKKILEWNKKTDQEIKKEKKEILLTRYFHQTRKNEESLRMLKDFLTNPFGNVIFNKILRIIDDSPPDIGLICYLANTLTRIVEVKLFGDLFEKHKYVLSQIERLTPQALAILYDYESWPEFDVSGGTRTLSVLGKVQTDWVGAFVKSYVMRKAISDPDKISRIMLSVRELKIAEFIDAQSIGRKKDRKLVLRAIPTAGGNEIIGYIEGIK